jgi:hypothetical protein
MKQRYVLGSYVPGFFVGQDYYNDPDNPDDTDLSSVSGLKHIQFRYTSTGEPVTVEATVATRTVKLENDDAPTAHQGMLVSATNMATNLTIASDDWWWRHEVDLAGDSRPCYCEWTKFTVYQ